MADLTKFDLSVNGVNQDTQYIKQRAYHFSDTLTPEMASSGTHDLLALPAGEMLAGLRLVSLKTAQLSGPGNMNFRLLIAGGEGADLFATALTDSAFTSGKVQNVPVSGIEGFSLTSGSVLQFTASQALTAFDFLLIVETIPVLDFLCQG